MFRRLRGLKVAPQARIDQEMNLACTVLFIFSSLEKGQVGSMASAPYTEWVKEGFSANTRAVVLTVSDRCSKGEQADVSGPAVARLLKAAGIESISTRIVPDEVDAIITALRHYARTAHLIITTGGTGLAARDVTPDATRLVCERLVEGLAERMRADGMQHTPFAALSRAVCGVTGKTLVVNLPGSPAGAETSLQSVLSLLPHALALLAGNTAHSVPNAR